jgi:hypothetical protein
LVADLLYYLGGWGIVVAGPSGIDAGVVNDDAGAELYQVEGDDATNPPPSTGYYRCFAF